MGSASCCVELAEMELSKRVTASMVVIARRNRTPINSVAKAASKPAASAGCWVKKRMVLLRGR